MTSTKILCIDRRRNYTILAKRDFSWEIYGSFNFVSTFTTSEQRARAEYYGIP